MIRSYLSNDLKRMTESYRDSEYSSPGKETSTKTVKRKQVWYVGKITGCLVSAIRLEREILLCSFSYTLSLFFTFFYLTIFGLAKQILSNTFNISLRIVSFVNMLSMM